MPIILHDGTDQYVMFRASASDLSGAFTGTAEGDVLPDAILIFSEYKKADVEIVSPAITWNATVGKWKAVIPHAYITQYGYAELNISGTGMIPVSVEIEIASSTSGGGSSVEQVVPVIYITLDANLKTITLANPYNTITAEQVLFIQDLNTGDIIYNSKFPRVNPITVTGGVIEYTHPSAEIKSSPTPDIIQIYVNKV